LKGQRRNRIQFLEPFTFLVALVLLLLLSAEAWDSPGLGAARAASTPVACPVTYPDGSSPPGEQSSPNAYANKNKTIWVTISVTGEMAVKREKDEWLWAPKVPWFRGVRGRLVLTGRRLDRSAPPTHSIVNSSYGDIGFQPASLGFPSEGCWEITGSVGGEKLTFVNKVRRKQNW